MALVFKMVLKMTINMKGLESYVTDRSLEADVGIWLAFPDGREINVLRAGGSNKAFIRAFSKATRPYRRQIERGTMDPDKSDDIMLRVYLDHVIIGWKGFTDENGVEVPYSKEAAQYVFTRAREMFQEIVNQAGDAANFQEEEAREAAEVLGEH